MGESGCSLGTPHPARRPQAASRTPAELCSSNQAPWPAWTSVVPWGPHTQAKMSPSPEPWLKELTQFWSVLCPIVKGTEPELQLVRAASTHVKSMGHKGAGVIAQGDGSSVPQAWLSGHAGSDLRPALWTKRSLSHRR